MNILNIEHVSKIYGDKVIFDDVSYGIHQGDKIGIIGINGTGKTTLLRIIAGLEETDEGQIIRQNGLRITYLPQNPEFPKDATILSYVNDGVQQHSWTPATEAKTVLNRLGIYNHDEEIEHLSGGQKKRVALARTIVNPADVLISEKYDSFAALPQGAKVGTSSLRRKAQLLNARPDLDIHDVRGHLQTRMRKMREENFDGIILAAAGVERLDWHDQITEELSYDICLPAVSQGVIGVETRTDDPEIIALVQLVNDVQTASCVAAERALLKSLEGGCQIPIGAYAQLEGDTVVLQGLVGSLDGKTIIRDEISGPVAQSEQLGRQLAQRLSEQGGQAILEEIRMELNQ